MKNSPLPGRRHIQRNFSLPHRHRRSLSAVQKLLPLLKSYRSPMPVSEAVIFPSGPGADRYYVCPRCHIMIEREFTSYCDRCGQHLRWHSDRKVQKIHLLYPVHL